MNKEGRCAKILTKMGIHFKKGLFRGIFLIGLGLALVACHDDTINNPLRDIEPPVIQLISPDSSKLIAKTGEVLDFHLEAADDKGLSLFQVDYQVQDPEGAILIPLTQLKQIPLSERFERLHFSDEVDTFPSFSRITYSFWVEDQRESRDQVEVVVTAIQPTPPSAVVFPTFTYTSRKLWSGASDSLSGFNFSTQQAFASNWENPLSIDITEMSTDETFAAQLSSPNNDRLNRDSIFVHLSPTQINFEEADYELIWSFYQSSTNFMKQSPQLEGGDLLIIKLSKAPQPQFALMRILKVQDLPGTTQDYLEFDYKVTSE